MDAIRRPSKNLPKKKNPRYRIAGVFVFILLLVTYIVWFAGKHSLPVLLSFRSVSAKTVLVNPVVPAPVVATLPPPPQMVDILAYDAKLREISHLAPIVASVETVGSQATVAPASVAAQKSPLPSKPDPAPLWPVKTAYPNAGALLPFNRIVAFYGNFYSKKMGVLGEYPEDQVLAKLAAEDKRWEEADPSTPVIEAIHYIAVTAQGSAGADGKYRLRMPDDQIQHAIDLARKIHGITFLDVQVANSTVQVEIPLLEKYLKMPDVHLGLDPEFSMKHGEKPGSVIGTMDASDINFAIQYLSNIVKENNLPPKILVVHRFTENMLTNYKQISPVPEVQVVMNMDGWGLSNKKITTYQSVIYQEPVQFTGFKLFFKNDIIPPSTRMLTPSEILQLTPQPMYIQYQ